MRVDLPDDQETETAVSLAWFLMPFKLWAFLAILTFFALGVAGLHKYFVLHGLLSILAPVGYRFLYCYWRSEHFPQGFRTLSGWSMLTLLVLANWWTLGTMVGDLSGWYDAKESSAPLLVSMLLPLGMIPISFRYREVTGQIWPKVGRTIAGLAFWLFGALLVGSGLGYLGYREPYGVLAVSLIFSGGILVLFLRIRERLEARG